MGAILRFILYFLVIYYVLKLVFRFFAPFMAKKMVEKATKNFEEQFNNPYYKEKPDVKEGETVIDKKSKEKSFKKSNNNQGEYIDYEEVD